MVYWGYNPFTDHLLTSWDIQGRRGQSQKKEIRVEWCFLKGFFTLKNHRVFFLDMLYENGNVTKPVVLKTNGQRSPQFLTIPLEST